jgi:hypothetical protein
MASGCITESSGLTTQEQLRFLMQPSNHSRQTGTCKLTLRGWGKPVVNLRGSLRCKVLQYRPYLEGNMARLDRRFRSLTQQLSYDCRSGAVSPLF